MKLTFSTDRIRHASISNDGHFLYHVITPGDPKRPDTSKIYRARAPRSPASQSPQVDRESQTSTRTSLSSLKESPVSPQAGLPGRKVPTEHELFGMGFEAMAEIEWHSIRPCQFAWLGGPVAGALDSGKCDSPTFIPSCDFWKRERTFPAPDGNTYRWKTGSSSILYRDDDRSGTPRPVAKYHSKRDSQCGYLEINLPPSYDLELEAGSDPMDLRSSTPTDNGDAEATALSSIETKVNGTDGADPDKTMVDLIVFTFIYVEKLRRNRDFTKSDGDE